MNIYALNPTSTTTTAFGGSCGGCAG